MDTTVSLSFALAFHAAVRDNTNRAYQYASELTLAVVASRSSLLGALLRTTAPLDRSAAYDFLRGLSRDELECLAEFQGACVLEMQDLTPINPYRLLPEFFDSAASERWQNADDCAHKTFIVLEWLDHRKGPASVRIRTNSVQAA